jgi:hypothetical protein
LSARRVRAGVPRELSLCPDTPFAPSCGWLNGGEHILPAVTVLSSLRVTIASAVAGGTAVIVLPICVLPVFRVLAANYEAWFSPLAIIL